MYVHRQARVCYLAHYKTASQATRNVLLRRGFQKLLGHHGMPWEIVPADPKYQSIEWPSVHWWLNQDRWDWTFYAGVRNHFDLFHSRIVDQPMYVHKNLKLCYVAHPRTASRAMAEALKARGFVKVFGHHGVPWGPGYLRDGPAPKEGDIWWWWNEPQNEYMYYASPRNHFDLFLTLAIMRDTQSIDAMRHYLWQHAAHYRCARILFPAFQELDGCRVLRFEHLRADLEELLFVHHLPKLKDEEFRRRGSDTHTANKPRDGWQGEISPELRRYIETSYATEMKRFGYSWDTPMADW